MITEDELKKMTLLTLQNFFYNWMIVTLKLFSGILITKNIEKLLQYQYKIIVDNLSTIIFRMLIEYKKIKYYAKQKYYN